MGLEVSELALDHPIGMFKPDPHLADVQVDVGHVRQGGVNSRMA
jgi:hypothetical protein